METRPKGRAAYSPASRNRDPRRSRNLGDMVAVVVVAVIVVVGTKSVWTSRALSPLYMCTTTPSSSSKDFHHPDGAATFSTS